MRESHTAQLLDNTHSWKGGLKLFPLRRHDSEHDRSGSRRLLQVRQAGLTLVLGPTSVPPAPY